MTKYSVVDRDAHDPAFEVVAKDFSTEYLAQRYIDIHLGQTDRFYVYSYETFGDY